MVVGLNDGVRYGKWCAARNTNAGGSRRAETPGPARWINVGIELTLARLFRSVGTVRLLSTVKPEKKTVLAMIAPGFATTDSVPQTRPVAPEIGQQDNGKDFVWEVDCPVGSQPHICKNVHIIWMEHVKSPQGEVRYKLAGREGSARAGDEIEMPPGQTHIHPRNAGPARWCTTRASNFPNPTRRLLWVNRPGRAFANCRPLNLRLASGSANPWPDTV